MRNSMRKYLTFLRPELTASLLLLLLLLLPCKGALPVSWSV